MKRRGGHDPVQVVHERLAIVGGAEEVEWRHLLSNFSLVQDGGIVTEPSELQAPKGRLDLIDISGFLEDTEDGRKNRELRID